MERLFAVIETEGAAWETGRPLEEQREWPAHAAFMDRAHEEGFIVLAGPLEGTGDRLLVARARSPEEIAQRLAPDPWLRLDLLRVARVAPWVLRLGALP